MQSEGAFKSSQRRETLFSLQLKKYLTFQRVDLLQTSVNLHIRRGVLIVVRFFFEDRANSSRGSIKRQLLSLIFAGRNRISINRNRIIMIRRERFGLPKQIRMDRSSYSTCTDRLILNSNLSAFKNIRIGKKDEVSIPRGLHSISRINPWTSFNKADNANIQLKFAHGWLLIPQLHNIYSPIPASDKRIQIWPPRDVARRNYEF